MVIDWTPPEPREGAVGYLDRFFGPGLTKAELGISLSVAAIGGALAAFNLTRKKPRYPRWKIAVAGLMGMDMAGGVFSNTSSSGKRWYNREGTGFKEHFLFISIHAAQMFLVSKFYPSMNWRYFGTVYGQLMASTLVVGATPLYLKRPVAFSLVCAAMATNSYLVEPPDGFEWFMPVLFLKLVAGHLLKEAPFRPESEGQTA